MAAHAYTEMYSRGRRGAPAKGVGRQTRRESSNLSISAKEKTLENVDFLNVFKGFSVLGLTARKAKSGEFLRVLVVVLWSKCSQNISGVS